MPSLHDLSSPVVSFLPFIQYQPVMLSRSVPTRITWSTAITRFLFAKGVRLWSAIKCAAKAVVAALATLRDLYAAIAWLRSCMRLCRSPRSRQHMTMSYRVVRRVLSPIRIQLRLCHRLVATTYDVHTGEAYSSPKPSIRDHLGH